MLKFVNLLVILSTYFHTISMQDFKRVCYMKADPEIPVDYIIRAQLCSHIIIGFVSVVDNVIEIDETYDMFILKCKTTIDEINSETLLMISVGGKTFSIFYLKLIIEQIEQVEIMKEAFILRLSTMITEKCLPCLPLKLSTNMVSMD